MSIVFVLKLKLLETSSLTVRVVKLQVCEVSKTCSFQTRTVKQLRFQKLAVSKREPSFFFEFCVLSAGDVKAARGGLFEAWAVIGLARFMASLTSPRSGVSCFYFVPDPLHGPRP